jgi:hypothetical protein
VDLDARRDAAGAAVHRGLHAADGGIAWRQDLGPDGIPSGLSSSLHADTR